MIRAHGTGAGAAGGVPYTPRPTSSSPPPTRPSGIGLDRARARLAGNDDGARDKATPHPPWDGEMIRSLVDQQISMRGNLRGRVVGRRAACRVAGSIIDEPLSIALGGGVHRPAVTKRGGRASDAPERDGRREEGAREEGARDARALGCARRGGRITRRQGKGGSRVGRCGRRKDEKLRMLDDKSSLLCDLATPRAGLGRCRGDGRGRAAGEDGRGRAAAQRPATPHSSSARARAAARRQSTDCGTGHFAAASPLSTATRAAVLRAY